MIRTQIQLSAEQHRRLRELASERGVSLSELVREGVDAVLAATQRERLWERAWQVVGKHHDREGARDVARRHDEYLDEAYGHGRGSR